MRVLAASAVLLLVPLVTAAEDVAAARATPAPVADAYRLQPGDVLLVSVWKEPDLTSETLIRPDGALSFPLAGEFAAADRTVDEVRAELQQRLREYVPEAVVTLTPRSLAGNRIFVIGKVARPGDFPLNRPIDVMQALALAGGTTAFADLSDIRILRRENGRQRVLEFRYGDVERGRRLEQNVLLQGGDTLIVP